MTKPTCEPDAVRRVAVIGAGTIGASWAAFFLSRGLQVAVYDSDPARARSLTEFLAGCWPALHALGAPVAASPERWSFHSDIRSAVDGADYVQESAPDNFTVKRQLFADLDALVSAAVVIASSTSSLLLSDLQHGLATAARFVVAHPFNPPHLIPLVEVVGGRASAPQAVEFCAAFLAGHGKVILRLRKEAIGHVVNRLQCALIQEAICLVRDGVVDIQDIDRGIEFGPALRWVLMGPFLTFHLGATGTGIRGYLDHLGAAYQQIWGDLGKVAGFTPELIESLVQGVERAACGESIADLQTRRDTRLADLLNHLSAERRQI